VTYAELHTHSYYSFHDGASSPEELLVQSRELGYAALALTDHNNLCGAMRFAHLGKSLGVRGIIGAELTIRGGFHLTVLAENWEGYRNLCRLITEAHAAGERNNPALDSELLPSHSAGLIVLSGCPKGELSQLIMSQRFDEARALASKYRDWFGPQNYFFELQRNLVYGERQRNGALIQLAKKLGLPVVATGNVHYHVRPRHRLQDCLVAIGRNKSLEESHRERRPNSEFYLRPVNELTSLFKECPEALSASVAIAERCSFDLASELRYTFPEYQAPNGLTPDAYLEKLCLEATLRRYGSVTAPVRARLDEEFALVRKFNLAGFLLLYHDVITLGREVMIEQGLSDPSLTLEENPPGRGRGSSVALLIGYLIGLSHIDPLKYKLSLERFLPADTMGSVPDIDLDFPRSIREELILRTHEKWGWQHAVLTGTIATYQIRGAVRDLGKALSLPPEEVDQLAKQTGYGSAKHLAEEMTKLPHFKEKLSHPAWRNLTELARELDGFPKYMGQHPGGMVISSAPLTDIVPIQRAATPGRYVCQWDKDSIDDAGFVKIDFLALGTLSQLQEAAGLVKKRTGQRLDMSRIDFDDQEVYDVLCSGDTIGIFQVESAAQMQTITRLKPRNLTDMAHEVGAVRPGVGVNNGVQEYLARRCKRKPVTFDHPLEERALSRTLGIILFQDQVNQLAVDVAGFSPSKADQLRRAFGRRHNSELIAAFRQEFLAGAARRGVERETALAIFKKFNGFYMFPESHAFAFGVTAFQAAWLKLRYPLEFFVAIFNQQPMGFYNLETIKEDARRHGIRVLNPDINLSAAECLLENGAVRLGFLNVLGLGDSAAKAIVESREREGQFQNVADFLKRSEVLEDVALRLAGAGAFDSLEPNRRTTKWEIGLRYRPVNAQLAFTFPVTQDMAVLTAPTSWERMTEEYDILSVHPAGHVMDKLRPAFEKGFYTSRDIPRLPSGTGVTMAGLVIRRQRPRGRVVFITLEDEFGHIPCMVFPQVYDKYERVFKSPFLVVKGRFVRRDGTHNVVISEAEPFQALEKVPASRDWR